MASAFLNASNLDFTSNGINSNVVITATPSSLDFTGVAAADVAITGLSNITASATIEGLTLTDGTVSITGGVISGATSFQTSGSITTDTSFILEDPGVGTNTITLQAPTLGASYSLTLPVDDGTLGQVLRTDGSGILSWITVSGSGDVTGPGSSTNTALVRWNGVGGTDVLDSVVTLSGSSMNFPDSVNATFGAGSDLVLEHNGSNSLITSTTGDLIINNTSATGSTVVLLGTATGATSLDIQDSGTSSLFNVDGTGLCTFSGVSNGTLSYDFGPGFLNIQDTTAASAGVGALVCAGGGTFTDRVRALSHVSTSDVAYKEEIHGLENPLDTLMKIEGYEYYLKNRKLDNRKQWGVIAQQLEDVGLGHIVGGEEGEKDVNYLAIIPLLVEAVKQLTKICTKEELI